MTNKTNKAYHWQFGNKVRDHMPAFVAMVEVSVVEMRGYSSAMEVEDDHAHGR